MKTASAKAKGYRQANNAKDYLLQRLSIKSYEDCWEWTKGKDKDGYGQCHCAKSAIENKVTRAHQLAFVAWKGSIPEGKIICHTCDNPSCCNPLHLYAGTHKDNVKDCVERGRHNNGSKPTVNYEDILFWKGQLSSTRVASMYGISFSRVCQIWRGEYGSKNSSK